MSKGDKNNRVKDWQGYWASFDSIFRKDKKVDEFGKWEYDNLHDIWSRIENGARVWYDEKPEE